MGKDSPRYTYDLFSQLHNPVGAHPELDWPNPERFPINLDTAKVEDTVLPDLYAGRDVLIITGFASLDRIIDFLSECSDEAQIRIVLGTEPFASRQDRFQLAGHQFTKEIETYWLKRGISLLLSGKLVRCIERLEKHQALVRYVTARGHPLHAKIYCTESAATVGSSNFTRPGMDRQLEANARFTAKQDSARYRELHSIAENFWRMGRDYNDELIKLLNQLLQFVTWQEALARACAELLEGDWAQAYLKGEYLPHEGELWPSQRQGIAQALYILTNQGSVLVADATGSGKTRMGVHLIGAVSDHILRSGRMRRGQALMVCPPAVSAIWETESVHAGVALDIRSHGTLSHTRAHRHDITLEQLRRAQILSVDEGHNFLNLKSARTKNLLRHMADHVMLFTATPLNRSVLDLLRIADLLGADNLADSTLDMFKTLLKKKTIDRSLAEEEIVTLRKELQRFTVRRTKQMLNKLIDREPDKYVDKNGRRCRFPKHKPKTYRLGEPSKDRQSAAQISQLADDLYGVTHFRKPIEMPDVLKRQGVSEENYLKGRLASAKKIARYIIMSSLRSSRAALAEHIVGTKQAKLDFNLQDFHKHTETGNTLSTLKKIGGKVPVNKLSIPLPDWLTDPEIHKQACKHDLSIYQSIHELLIQISDKREREKASLLLKILKNEDLLLAFDNRPITLHEIARHIYKINSDAHLIIATGDSGSQRDDILSTFALDSEASQVIGLCSDSLSEGVNLQKASALVHLDMPSVVRIAEQRVGRVDRLDSPHSSIEAWWPEDAPEFALSADDKFVERYETVETLLGSNMPLPESLQKIERKPIDTKNLIEEYEQKAEKGQWDGIHDAFAPVRNLVESVDALVDEHTYENYRKVVARVISRVGLVRSESPWAFFCMRGGSFGVPRWILLPSTMGKAITELGLVCEALRERLTPETENMRMTEKAEKYLMLFLKRLTQVERILLPRKKQRALEEMEHILKVFLKHAVMRADQNKVDGYKIIIDALSQPSPEHQPDWDELASTWLDLIRPTWYTKLAQPRARPLLLKDIRKELLQDEESFGAKIFSAFQSFPELPPPDERISVCIIGVG